MVLNKAVIAATVALALAGPALAEMQKPPEPVDLLPPSLQVPTPPVPAPPIAQPPVAVPAQPAPAWTMGNASALLAFIQNIGSRRIPT